MVGSGHFASVLALDERTGLALCTDGVGTKLIVAEHLNGKLNASTARCVTCARELKPDAIDVLVLAAAPDAIAAEAARVDVGRRVAAAAIPGQGRLEVAAAIDEVVAICTDAGTWPVGHPQVAVTEAVTKRSRHSIGLTHVAEHPV